MSTHALRLVTGGGFRGELPRLFLGASALREVARDLGESDEGARCLVAERGDHDICPEARSVLAEAPALVLDPTRLRRDVELPRRLARVDVGLGVKDREVLADDLRFAVALEPRRAGIPRAHDAALVEEKDRVVRHALDEQPMQ